MRMIPIDITDDLIGKTVIAIADYSPGAASVGIVILEIEIPKQVKQTCLSPWGRKKFKEGGNRFMSFWTR